MTGPPNRYGASYDGKHDTKDRTGQLGVHPQSVAARRNRDDGIGTRHGLLGALRIMVGALLLRGRAPGRHHRSQR